MKCQACKKRQATVHLTEIIESEKREKHLCEECAHKQTGPLQTGVSHKELLANVITQLAPEIHEMSKTICPSCGLSYLEFRSQGRLGCASDYVAFKKGLVELLDKIHGSTQHIGKTPGDGGADADARKTVQSLRQQLEEAVAQEEFEKAAQLRDTIRELTGQHDANG